MVLTHPRRATAPAPAIAPHIITPNNTGTQTAATTPAVSRLLAGRLEQTSLGRRMNMCGKTLSTLWAFGKTYPSKSRGSIRIWMPRARMQRSRRNNNQLKKKRNFLAPLAACLNIFQLLTTMYIYDDYLFIGLSQGSIVCFLSDVRMGFFNKLLRFKKDL